MRPNRSSRFLGGRLVTIGYEGRTIEDLTSMLLVAGVQVLVDVRENAISRKPGFSKRRLGEVLNAAGIDYRHEPLLGNPKDNRDAFRAGSSAARKRFVAHLNNGSRSTYDDVMTVAETKVVALMCFEREHSECHRSCIAEQAREERPALSLVTL